MSNRATFISAGYFLTRRCPRPAWAHGGKDLLPATIVTLSPCLTDVVPDLWPSSSAPPPQRPDQEARARLGISSANGAAAERWADERNKLTPTDWPLPFATLDDLQTFVERFVDRDADVLLIGVALPDDLVPRFFEQRSEVLAGSERYIAARRALAPAASGSFIGFEILGDGMNESHSIVCTGGEVGVHDSLGMTFNADGLIDCLSDARRAAEWASDAHGEPVTYFPWRMTLYQRQRSR